MAMKKVLVVEDDVAMQYLWGVLLKSQVVLLSAFSTEEAALFVTDPGIDAIVMDAHVPGKWRDTAPLVRKFRDAGFEGPMIAAASEPAYNQILMEAGCDYEAEKEKVPQKIIEVLGL